MPTHKTISGHSIDYDVTNLEREFLARVESAAKDPTVSSDDLTALVYSDENPLLDDAPTPELAGRGMITRATLANPIYHVMVDLLERKRLSAAQIQRIAARYTMPVAEAADVLSVGLEAVRKLCRARRIPSWMKDGAYYVDPSKIVEQWSARGEKSPAQPARPLVYEGGYDGHDKAYLRVKTPTGEVGDHGKIANWERVAVVTAGGGTVRVFVLEPAETPNEIAFRKFYVRGNFKIVEKINNTAKARVAWDEFKAA